MEKIAFITGDSFVYWSPILLALAGAAAAAVYAAFYLVKSKNFPAMGLSILLSVFLSIPLSRLVHWYCRASNYPSFQAAMTDHTVGGYALLGVFAACLLTACLLRLVRISADLPQMLDCMAIGGGVGIGLGRLASLFNASDWGMILPDSVTFPFAYPVTNPVSGAVENRLATFMLQAMLTGGIVAALLIFMLIKKLLKKKIANGDVFLIFLLAYGACQAVCDSTRHDSLFFRSNGFVSMVQVMGLVSLVFALVLFSVRLVKRRGLKVWQFIIWIGILGLLGTAGYMEYYVQRNAHKAVIAYSVMGGCLAAVVLLGLLIRTLAQAKAPVGAQPAEQ